jgi:uncharacterized BrkB/YihY/UPF0761 family membrane protein
MNVPVWRRRLDRFLELERVAFRRIDEAAVRTFAASIAYHAILALVSFSSVVLFLVQVGLGSDVIGERSGHHLPTDLRDAAHAQAERIADLSSSGIALMSIIGIGFGLYGLASGFAALFDALNRIHGTHRYASMVVRYGRAGIIAICFTATFAFAVAVVAASTAAGTEFFDSLGLPLVGILASGVALVLVVLVLVPVTFMLLLRYGSRARPPWAQCAAAGVVSGWGTLLFSLGFLAWVAFSEPYRLYGAMSTALVILVFAYWAAYLMLATVIFAEEFAHYARTWLLQARQAYVNRDRSLTWLERYRRARARRKSPDRKDVA